MAGYDVIGALVSRASKKTAARIKKTPPGKPIGRRGGNAAGTVQEPTTPGYPPKTKTKTTPNPPTTPTVVPPIKPPQTPLDIQAQQDKQGLDIISQYNQAYGKILKGIPTDIGQIYKDAAGQTSGLASGFSQATRDRLAAAGAGAEHQIGLQAGSEFAPGIEGSYNAGPVGDTGYALGGYFPSSSLTKQGAAWQAGAELLPLKAYGEGQYALLSEKKRAALELSKQALAAEKAGVGKEPKVNTTLSKSMGVLMDVYGHPILNAKGKTIPVPDNLTPYQIEQLKISQARLLQSNARLALSQEGLKVNSNLALKRLELQYAKWQQEGKTIDAAASKVAGHVVLNDGTEPVDPRTGKTYNVAPTASATVAISKAVGKGQKYIKQMTTGYMASSNDLTKPLSMAELRAISKKTGLSVGEIVYGAKLKKDGSKDVERQKAINKVLDNEGIEGVQIQAHDDDKIQKLYEDLVKVYRIPALRAFNMVAKVFKQWGAHNRPTYFPNG